MDKDDIKYILCEITDNNSIFELEEGYMNRNIPYLGIKMTTNTGWDRNQFHSQDCDTVESLMRLHDMGLNIFVEVKNKRSWGGADGEKITMWTPELQEWCYSIKVPIGNLK